LSRTFYPILIFANKAGTYQRGTPLARGQTLQLIAGIALYD
jgi:hypothetical protein